MVRVQGRRPTLLALTVHQFTGVPINYYAEIDLNHMRSLVDAIGGVNVTLSASGKSYGHTFSVGVNHLTGITAIYYARDPSLTDEARMLREENLLRAILLKIASDHLLTNPVTAIGVLNAITGTLTVDSNLTNSEVLLPARKLGGLGGNAATFVTAPTQTVNGKLVLNPAVTRPALNSDGEEFDREICQCLPCHPATLTPEVLP